MKNNLLLVSFLPAEEPWFLLISYETPSRLAFPVKSQNINPCDWDHSMHRGDQCPAQWTRMYQLENDLKHWYFVSQVDRFEGECSPILLFRK